MGFAKEKTFQADSITSMTDSELGGAYLNMLRDCKVSTLGAQTLVGDPKAGITAAPVQPCSLNASEEYRIPEQKVWEKVCGVRRARLRFHSIRPGANPAKFSLSDIYKPNGQLMQAFKSSRSGNWQGQKESEMRAFIFGADTFDYRKQGSARPGVEWTDEMSHLFKWLAPHKDNNTMVMCFDGRSKACRRKLDDWVCENYPDEGKQAELWVTYAGLTAGTDPREPKRKLAFSDKCCESVLVGLPVPKTVLKAKPRPCFTACGEVSTHSQTYSAVPKRSVDSLPRLQKEEKKAMIGEQVEDLNSGLTEAATRGHALFWNEVRSVGLLSQMLSDFGIHHVMDLSPSSGALAAAAALNHVTYDGFCFNDSHKQWLEGIMDRVMLKVLTDKDVPNHDHGFSEDIKKYFAASVGDAENLISESKKQADEIKASDDSSTE